MHISYACLFTPLAFFLSECCFITSLVSDVVSQNATALCRNYFKVSFENLQLNLMYVYLEVYQIQWLQC